MPKVRQLQMRRVVATLGANARSGLFIGMVLAFAVLFVSAIAFWLFEDNSNTH